MAFSPWQCTSPQLHPCHRLFDQDGRQDSSSLSLSSRLAPCDFWLFPELRGCRYETTEEMKEAVTKVIDTLTQEDFKWVLPEVVGTVQVHWSRRRLFWRGLEFRVWLSIKVPIRKSLETYLMILVYIYIYIYIYTYLQFIIVHNLLHYHHPFTMIYLLTLSWWQKQLKKN